MTKTNELRPNDLYQCKVGRNTMLVTLIAEDDSLKGEWLVRSTKTGKEMIIRDTSRLKLSETSEYEHAQEAREEAKPKRKPGKTSLLDAAAQVLNAGRQARARRRRTRFTRCGQCREKWLDYREVGVAGSVGASVWIGVVSVVTLAWQGTCGNTPF